MNLTYFEQFYDEFINKYGYDKVGPLMTFLSMDCQGTVMLCFWKGRLLKDCCQYVRLVSGDRKACLVLTLPQEKDGSPAKQMQPGEA